MCREQILVWTTNLIRSDVPMHRAGQSSCTCNGLTNFTFDDQSDNVRIKHMPDSVAFVNSRLSRAQTAPQSDCIPTRVRRRMGTRAH